MCAFASSIRSVPFANDRASFDIFDDTVNRIVNECRLRDSNVSTIRKRYDLRDTVVVATTTSKNVGGEQHLRIDSGNDFNNGFDDTIRSVRCNSYFTRANDLMRLIRLRDIVRRSKQIIATDRCTFDLTKSARRMGHELVDVCNVCTVKLAEIVDCCPWLISVNKELRVCDLCCAPGGFLDYLFLRKAWSVKCYGVTLPTTVASDTKATTTKPKTGTRTKATTATTTATTTIPPTLTLKRRSKFPTRVFECDIETFADELRNDRKFRSANNLFKVDLVLADGASLRANVQMARENYNILNAQWNVAKKLLVTGGHFVLKTFSLFDSDDVCENVSKDATTLITNGNVFVRKKRALYSKTLLLVIDIARCFEDGFEIVKPKHSKLFNDERYICFKRYVGINKSKHVSFGTRESFRRVVGTLSSFEYDLTIRHALLCIRLLNRTKSPTISNSKVLERRPNATKDRNVRRSSTDSRSRAVISNKSSNEFVTICKRLCRRCDRVDRFDTRTNARSSRRNVVSRVATSSTPWYSLHRCDECALANKVNDARYVSKLLNLPLRYRFPFASRPR